MTYDAIEICQYGVPEFSFDSNEMEDCGQPACMVVWWKDDSSDKMFVCTKHFNEILESEKLKEEDEE